MLEDFLNGDESAFRKIVEENETQVYNAVLSVVKNEEDAIDVTQDVFIKVFERAATFKGNSQVGTWIYRIAMNTALDFIKKKKRRKPFEYFYSLLSDNQPPGGTFTHPGVRLEDREDAAALFTALDRLPGKQQAAFVLFYIEEKSQKEIAEILQLSIGAVESLLFRAKQKLQKQLNDYYNK